MDNIIDLYNKYKENYTELNEYHYNIDNYTLRQLIHKLIYSGTSFTGLYTIKDNKLYFVKNKKKLLFNINDFDRLASSLPKSFNDFYVYRSEIKNLDSLEINYYAPFSTTYNLDFALSWTSEILYIIKVPKDCNYILSIPRGVEENKKLKDEQYFKLYLENKIIESDYQFEITLQYGKLKINNKDNKNKIYYCNFIPISYEENKKILEDLDIIC